MTVSELGMMLDQMTAAGWGDVDVAVKLADVILMVDGVTPMSMESLASATTDRLLALDVRL